MPAVFRKVAIWLTARDRMARDDNACRPVLDFPCNRSRTGAVKSVGGRNAADRRVAREARLGRVRKLLCRKSHRLFSPSRPYGPAPEGPRTAARGQIENAPRDQGAFWSGFVT